ncbi:MAG: hypothetical protein F2914_07980 [Actinobacteria bacterium]|nr:hypothetical protein [Actinomycetota bacterium]
MSETRVAVIVGAFAGAIRALWVILAARAPVGLSDPSLYLAAAASIAGGKGYTSFLGRPTAYYPPGYPLFLAGIQKGAELLGQQSRLVWFVVLAQAVLGGIAAAALVIAGCRIRQSIQLGVLAGMIFALWPNLIIHSGLVLSESLYLCCFCIFLAALFTWMLKLQSQQHGHSGAVLVLVLATAACTLVRPQSVAVMLPAAALAWFISGLGWRFALRGSGLLLAGMLIAILPWTLRNTVVMNAFVPISTNTGDNLCMGFHSGATGGFSFSPECATEGDYIDGPKVEVERDADLRTRAMSWIAAHPGEIPELSYKKLRITLRQDADAVFAWESYGADAHLSQGQRSLLNRICNVYYWLVGLLGLAGSVVVLRDCWADRNSHERSVQAGIGLVALSFSIFGALLPVLFFGDERFKIPILPCVALLAALAIHSFFRRNPDGSATGTQPDVASETAEQEARQ